MTAQAGLKQTLKSHKFSIIGAQHSTRRGYRILTLVERKEREEED
jgi:hypothetical protein